MSMSRSATLGERVEELGKASRRAATISLLGFVLILGALAYATSQLRSLERERAKLEIERQHLAGDVQRYRVELDTIRLALTNARRAVAAARAAINAFHAGRLNDAVSLYNEALEGDPTNAYLHNLRAYTLFRLGSVEEAIEGQRRSLAADSTYAWGYFDLARFLCAASPPRLAEARSAAAKALALRPEMRVIMNRDGEFQRVCRRQVP